MIYVICWDRICCNFELFSGGESGYYEYINIIFFIGDKFFVIEVVLGLNI